MGRVGFNLINQKKPSENVEAGEAPPPEAPKETPAESVDISELLVILGQAHRKIKSLRLVLIFVSLVLIFENIYIIFRVSENYGAVRAIRTEEFLMMRESDPIEALQQQRNALLLEKEQVTERGYDESTDSPIKEPPTDLQDWKDNDCKKNLEMKEKVFSSLQKEYWALQHQYKTDIKTCTKEKQELEAQILATSQRPKAIEEQTTNEKDVSPDVGFFEPTQQKKIDSILKEIDTGLLPINFEDMIEKINEAFVKV